MQIEKSHRRSNRERTEETRAALVSAARHLFVEKGYAETSTPEIVKAAGITRGALYHHFTDKEDLFRAVIRAEYEMIAREIGTSALGSKDPIDALMSGGEGFLDAMSDKGRVRLLLLDAPAVLGRLELDELDRETSANELRIGLQTAMDAGQIRKLPIEALTALLSAMFDRAALSVAAGDSREDHLEVFRAVLEAMKP